MESDPKLLEHNTENFLGGTEGKNPPANAGDTGLAPDSGRPQMLRGDCARLSTTEPVLWSLGATATEPRAATPEAAHRPPVLHTRSRHRGEKLHAATSVAHARHNQGRPTHSSEDPAKSVTDSQINTRCVFFLSGALFQNIKTTQRTNK